MKNIACNLSFKTNYNFKVIRNDKIIQEENTHNVILDSVLTKRYANNPSYGCYAFGESLLVGNGTGTPSGSDTALFNQLWKINTRDLFDLIDIDDENNSITVRYVFSIPATSSYVGKITECGLYGNFSNYQLYTHALVRDAEGNPISIDKTDLDKIIITIDLTLTLGSNDPDIKIIPVSKSAFRHALKFGDNSSFQFFNCVVASISSNSKSDIITLVQNPEAILQRGVEGAASWDYGYEGIPYYIGMPRTNYSTTIPSDNVRHCVGRIAQNAYDSGKVGYVKAIVVLGAFVISLPNANYFPSYPLVGIEVGASSAGDTEILCPLDHFVKDTEVIYKNGVALTRDVDYTVDSENNHRGLVELTAANDAIITGGISRLIDPVSSASEPFRARNNYISGYSAKIQPNCIYGFSTAAPLFFDMQKEVTLNFLRVPTDYNHKYTLSYSADGVTYEQHIVRTFTADTGYTFEFVPVTARYFKLEVTTANDKDVTVSPNPSSNSTNTPEKFFALGYKTDGMIKFTTPLEEGDIITMDCMMDLPYKTENNVIDYDFSISL